MEILEYKNTLLNLGIDPVTQIWMVYSSLNEKQKILHELLNDYLSSNKELQKKLYEHRFENGTIEDLDDDLKPHVSTMLGMMVRICEDYRNRLDHEFSSPQFD